MRTESLALFSSLLLLASCGDDPKRGLNETCGADFECASGLCLENRCLAPDGDEDQDGLSNAVEGQVGSNALSKDTDLDGIGDFDELGGGATAKDSDGDGFLDILESDRDDLDHDCIPNQRDPVNDVAETDLAVVADRACCCQGLCSASGVAASATCSGGVLSCDPTEPDRDGDGVADACDTPLIALSASEVQSGCATACADVAEHCAGQLPDCLEACVARASDEGLWLANYECFGVACSQAKCFDTPGFAEDGSCKDACIHSVGCDVATYFGGAEGAFTEPVCRAECAGQYRANGDGVAVLACLATIDVPDEDCHLVDALPCVLGDQLCSDACDKLVFPPSDDTCPSGAPAYQGFTTDALCTNGCAALSGFGEVAFLGCSAVKGCSDFAATCKVDAPHKDGCETACAALATACPVVEGPLADPSLCDAFCSGVATAAPWIAPADASACIAASAGCDSNEEAIATLSRCLLTASPEPRCVSACDAFAACAVELGGPAPEDCARDCSALVVNHPERIEPTLACSAQSASCAETKLCVPAAPEDVCKAACVHRVGCDPNYLGGEAQCAIDCRANIAADQDSYAAWMCESQARDCETNCGELPALVPDAECVSACAGKDTCIEAAYGLCARACQGVRRAYGSGTSNSCITETLGRRCDAVAVKACGGT